MSKFKPTEFEPDVNVTKTHPLKETAWLVGSIFGIIIGVYILFNILLILLVPRVSVETEMKIWNTLHFSKLLEEEAPEKYKKQQTHLDKLLKSLPDEIKPDGYDFKIGIIEDSAINAYAFPGGFIGITSGLLDKIEDENTLTFIIGHELGHFEERHHLKSLGLFAGTSLMTIILLGSSDAAQSFVSGFISLADLANSRHDETDADEWALKTLHLHYGHVSGFDSFFKMVQAEDSIEIPEMLSTHPISENRIEHISKLIKKNNYTQKETKPLPWKKN